MSNIVGRTKLHLPDGTYTLVDRYDGPVTEDITEGIRTHANPMPYYRVIGTKTKEFTLFYNGNPYQYTYDNKGMPKLKPTGIIIINTYDNTVIQPGDVVTRNGQAIGIALSSPDVYGKIQVQTMGHITDDSDAPLYDLNDPYSIGYHEYDTSETSQGIIKLAADFDFLDEEDLAEFKRGWEEGGRHHSDVPF